MIGLHNLKSAPGAVKNRKRIGRGPGSGFGKTAGRGQNGQKSRTGYHRNLAFEGGQMPLIRRIPKRGFTNIFKQRFNIVSLDALAKTGLDEVTIADYFARKLARNKRAKIKVLGDGKLTRKMTIHAHQFSHSALAKIKKAGGQAVVFKGDKEGDKN